MYARVHKYINIVCTYTCMHVYTYVHVPVQMNKQVKQIHRYVHIHDRVPTKVLVGDPCPVRVFPDISTMPQGRDLQATRSLVTSTFRRQHEALNLKQYRRGPTITNMVVPCS